MRCLLIDDDLKHLARLKKFLEEEAFVVDTAYDGQMGSYLCRAHAYDIVLTKYHLPKKTAVQICTETRCKGNAVPILVLCPEDAVTDRIDGFSAGADDCLSIPYSTAELIARVRALLRRGAQLREDVVEIGRMRVNFTTQQIFVSNRLIRTSSKRFAILELLIRNRGRVVPRSTVLEHVWNMDVDPTSNSLETLVWKLRTDLGKVGRELIRTVPGRGYVIE